MINGTWVTMLDGSRVAAVHLGEGKVRGAAHTVPDPTPEDKFNRKTIMTAEESERLIKANEKAVAAALAAEDQPAEPAEDAPAEPAEEEEAN